MTRGQRRLHALVWPVLALVLAGVIGAAMYERVQLTGASAAAEGA